MIVQKRKVISSEFVEQAQILSVPILLASGSRSDFSPYFCQKEYLHLPIAVNASTPFYIVFLFLVAAARLSPFQNNNTNTPWTKGDCYNENYPRKYCKPS